MVVSNYCVNYRLLPKAIKLDAMRDNPTLEVYAQSILDFFFTPLFYVIEEKIDFKNVALMRFMHDFLFINSYTGMTLSLESVYSAEYYKRFITLVVRSVNGHFGEDSSFSSGYLNLANRRFHVSVSVVNKGSFMLVFRSFIDIPLSSFFKKGNMTLHEDLFSKISSFTTLVFGRRRDNRTLFIRSLVNYFDSHSSFFYAILTDTVIDAKNCVFFHTNKGNIVSCMDKAVALSPDIVVLDIEGMNSSDFFSLIYTPDRRFIVSFSDVSLSDRVCDQKCIMFCVEDNDLVSNISYFI